MSLVGTRPPTVDEWDKYELHHRARLATKPGLTGMWQVSGRSNKAALRMLCAGFCADSGDSFLWNYDCRALLYWNCCRFLSALPE